MTTDKFDLEGVLLVVCKECGENANALRDGLCSKGYKSCLDEIRHTV